MFDKIKNGINNLFYGLNQGLKAADDEIMRGVGAKSYEVPGVVQQVEAQNVYEALLRGEVTQEVKELRYAMYRVLRETNKYSYTPGEARGVKRDTKNVIYNILRQENKAVTMGITEAMKHLNETQQLEYLVKFTYRYAPIFNLERCLKEIIINRKEKKATLRFSEYNGSMLPSEGYFLKVLNTLSDIKTDKEIKSNDILSSIKSIEFITDNCEGIEDFYKVSLIDISTDIDTLNFQNKNGNIDITFNCGDIELLDILKVYDCPEMEAKYLNKTAKAQKPYIPDEFKVRLETCEECGAMVDKHDAEETKKLTGKVLCYQCLEKKIKGNVEDKPLLV